MDSFFEQRQHWYWQLWYVLLRDGYLGGKLDGSANVIPILLRDVSYISQATAYTPHVCTVSQSSTCEGTTQCGNTTATLNAGICDKDGCDFNSFRLGDKSFYGPGLTVDTNKPITVVTQFHTSDNTANGNLVEIRRLYVQNGVTIQNSKTSVPGMATFDSVTDAFCNAQKTAFGDENSFEQHGGLTQMGNVMSKGMVLVMSLWDDYAVDMVGYILHSILS